MRIIIYLLALVTSAKEIFLFDDLDWHPAARKDEKSFSPSSFLAAEFIFFSSKESLHHKDLMLSIPPGVLLFLIR